MTPRFSPSCKKRKKFCRFSENGLVPVNDRALMVLFIFGSIVDNEYREFPKHFTKIKSE